MQSNKKEDSYLFKYKVGYTTGTFESSRKGKTTM